MRKLGIGLHLDFNGDKRTVVGAIELAHLYQLVGPQWPEGGRHRARF